EWLDTLDRYRSGSREAWKLDLKIEHVAAEDYHRAIRIHVNSVDRRKIDDHGRKGTRRARNNSHVIRTLVQSSTNCPELAGCGELTVDDEQDGISKLLDLLQNVRRQ